MGHVGAIISAFGKSAQEKVENPERDRSDHRAEVVVVWRGHGGYAGEDKEGGVTRDWLA